MFYYYRMCQKMFSQGDVRFFNPKIVAAGSGVDQNTKLSSFSPIGQKPPILHGKLF